MQKITQVIINTGKHENNQLMSNGTSLSEAHCMLKENDMLRILLHIYYSKLFE